MNISEGFRNLQQVLGSEPATQAAQKTSNKTVAPTPLGKEGLTPDEAHVSSAASLATLAATASDVRMEKVTAIQQSLAAGTYKVSDSAVADSLINHMLQR